MARALALGAIVCLALTACSDLGSTAPSSTSATASKLAQAQATHEYPPPRTVVQHATGAGQSAVDAIRRFASAYINWNAQTVTSDMRTLAARSVGQARAAVQLAAAGTAEDYELRQGGIANSGTVQAIAPLTARRNRYVVVTLERTTASSTTSYQGLRRAWHVALATVVQLSHGRWALSDWQPQN